MNIDVAGTTDERDPAARGIDRDRTDPASRLGELADPFPVRDSPQPGDPFPAAGQQKLSGIIERHGPDPTLVGAVFPQQAARGEFPYSNGSVAGRGRDTG